nr:hypothetical protein [Tanacetum cinerariifolium]
NYNMHGMGKTINELHAMLKLHEETRPKKDANPALHAIQAGKTIKINRTKLTTPPPNKDNPAKDAICHQCCKDRHWRRNCPVYLTELMKKKKLTQGASTSGLRGRKKLKPGALSLYAGDGHHIAVEAIETYHLELPIGLVIVLNNCHYAPSITRGQEASYFVTFADDFRRYGYVYLLKHKHEVFEIFKGCEAFVKRDTLTKPDKLEPRSFKCIFVGYLKETMGYSFYSPSENKVFVARNFEFFKSKLLDLKASGSVKDLELIKKEDTNPSVDTSLNQEEGDQEIDEPQSDINPTCKSSMTRHAPDRMCLYIDAEEHEIGDLDEPANYKATLLDPESKKWLDAMNVEMKSMKDNDVWVLVELPPNARTVGSKWLFKKKTDMDVVVYNFKARLVAKGFTQTYGVDYEETFSPVADIRAIRILIAVAAYYDYQIWQMDVKTAFLNGHLSEEVYMEQLEGFVNPKYPNHVCKLKHSIYGLKSFDMKDLAEAAYILGIKIYRDRLKRLIGLCQKAYIEKILKIFYMENSKRGTIPMQETLKLSKSQGASTPAEKERMQNISYTSAV